MRCYMNCQVIMADCALLPCLFFHLDRAGTLLAVSRVVVAPFGGPGWTGCSCNMHMSGCSPTFMSVEYTSPSCTRLFTHVADGGCTCER